MYRGIFHAGKSRPYGTFYYYTISDKSSEWELLAERTMRFFPQNFDEVLEGIR